MAVDDVESSLARRNLIRTRASRSCQASVAIAASTVERSKPATGSRKMTADTSWKSASVKRPVTRRATRRVPRTFPLNPSNAGPFNCNV